GFSGVVGKATITSTKSTHFGRRRPGGWKNIDITGELLDTLEDLDKDEDEWCNDGEGDAVDDKEGTEDSDDEVLEEDPDQESVEGETGPNVDDLARGRTLNTVSEKTQ
ncbi:hypothetical protein BGW38_009934, partial [Lunasporangiospora selenospora]